MARLLLELLQLLLLKLVPKLLEILQSRPGLSTSSMMWLEIQFEMMWLGAIQESINANSELRKQFLVVGNACILVVIVFHSTVVLPMSMLSSHSWLRHALLCLESRVSAKINFTSHLQATTQPMPIIPLM